MSNTPPRQTSAAQHRRTPISPGEYCTIVRAQELGILDAKGYKENPAAAPFNGLYKDLKTYDATIDAQDKRTKTLCKVTLDGKEAYPHCTEMHGPGFVKLGTPDANQPFKCEVKECPPGFTKQGQYCNKEPLFADAKIDKRARCDERWYDWFLIPNYHLGNKFYEEKVGKCFAPCPVRHVPSYAKDPVDGARADFSSEDDLTRCVPRDAYFAGKYADGTDYCPLSWIMRVYASNPKYAKEMLHARRKRIADLYGNERDPSKDRLTQPFRNVARLEGNDIAKEAAFLSGQVGGYLENVVAPSGPMAQACNTLNTQDNLDVAYKVCKELNELNALDISTGAMNAKQNVVLKQACNAVFCNENDDALDIIGRDPICFDKPRKLTDGELNDEDADPQAPTYDKQQSFFQRSFRTFLMLVFVPIFLTLGYFAWTRFFWPKVIRPPFLIIWGKLTGRTFAAMKYREARFAEIEHERGQILRSRR
jgi:hypothetical protein